MLGAGGGLLLLRSLQLKRVPICERYLVSVRLYFTLGFEEQCWRRALRSIAV